MHTTIRLREAEKTYLVGKPNLEIRHFLPDPVTPQPAAGMGWWRRPGWIRCRLRGGGGIHPAVHPGAGDDGRAMAQDHSAGTKYSLKECAVILILLIRWVVKKLGARRHENLEARQQVQSR
jgi:hypothetical protein